MTARKKKFYIPVQFVLETRHGRQEGCEMPWKMPRTCTTAVLSITTTAHIPWKMQQNSRNPSSHSPTTPTSHTSSPRSLRTPSALLPSLDNSTEKTYKKRVNKGGYTPGSLLQQYARLGKRQTYQASSKEVMAVPIKTLSLPLPNFFCQVSRRPNLPHISPSMCRCQASNDESSPNSRMHIRAVLAEHMLIFRLCFSDKINAWVSVSVREQHAEVNTLKARRWGRDYTRLSTSDARLHKAKVRTRISVRPSSLWKVCHRFISRSTAKSVRQHRCVVVEDKYRQSFRHWHIQAHSERASRWTTRKKVFRFIDRFVWTWKWKKTTRYGSSRSFSEPPSDALLVTRCTSGPHIPWFLLHRFIPFSRM